MDMFECASLNELLEKKAKDFPQMIVAGWMLPQGRLVGGTVSKVDSPSEATVGKSAASYAACLAAVLTRIGQLAADHPGLEDSILEIVGYVVDNMTVVKRFKNTLITREVLDELVAMAAASKAVL